MFQILTVHIILQWQAILNCHLVRSTVPTDWNHLAKIKPSDGKRGSEMFAEKLKEARTAKGLSQGALSGKLDIKRQTVSNWEAGISFPEVENVLRIAVILNVSLDSLFADEIAYLRKETNPEDPQWERFGKPLAEVLLTFAKAVDNWAANLPNDGKEDHDAAE